MRYSSRRSYAALFFCFLCCGLCAWIGCGETTPTELVSYREFGDEFLPQIVAIYEQPASASPNTCTMVYVLYALEARIPTPDDETSHVQLLTLTTGHTASGKTQWRLTLVERRVAEGERKWVQSGRLGFGNTMGFSGAHIFPAQPTWSELESFVERAELQRYIDYYYIKLDAGGDTSHRYFVRAKTYDQELRELFGRVPPFLSKLNQERFADDPKPKKKI
jgi:hypothetical protein